MIPRPLGDGEDILACGAAQGAAPKQVAGENVVAAIAIEIGNGGAVSAVARLPDRPVLPGRIDAAAAAIGAAGIRGEHIKVGTSGEVAVVPEGRLLRQGGLPQAVPRSVKDGKLVIGLTQQDLFLAILVPIEDDRHRLPLPCIQRVPAPDGRHLPLFLRGPPVVRGIQAQQ